MKFQISKHQKRNFPYIRPFKFWHSHVLLGNGEAHVYLKPNEPPVEMSIKEYEAKNFKPYFSVLISKHAATKEDYRVGYLYKLESKDYKTPEEYDVIDQLFLAGIEGSSIYKYVLYGLHSYGGYYGFFRPR